MVEECGITLKNINFRIGEFFIQDLSIDIRKGEYFVLTGPNGSGKTVLIRLIAGLYRPLSGDIRLGDRDVTDVPPWSRDLAYVPQDGVLFPNMTVRENIRFGLEMHGVGRETREKEVGRAADTLGIEHLLDRSIEGLSGGETQKVSLARALVLEPSVLLLDEPVSAVDEGSRDALCRRLREIQSERGLTMLHVSHNRKETRLVADRMAVMRNGAMGDIGEPDSVLDSGPRALTSEFTPGSSAHE